MIINIYIYIIYNVCTYENKKIIKIKNIKITAELTLA